MTSDWAKGLADDLGHLAALTRRTAPAVAVEPGGAAGDPSVESPGALDVLRELLEETRALRVAVERQAEHQERLLRVAMAGVPVLLDGDDLAESLGLSRREVDRMRSVGEIPAPDVILGRSPRWNPETVRQAIVAMAKRGRR